MNPAPPDAEAPATMRVLSLFLAFFLAGSSPVEAQHETHSGSGDDVVEITKPDPNQPALLVVQGNAEARHFAIIGHTAGGDRVGAFVNTTEPYSGIVSVDLPPSSQTAILEVSAPGAWEMHVYPIGAAQRIEAPGTFEGEGDNVLWIEGEASVGEIQGNASSRHFALIAYDGRGGRLRALVNTTDPYQGRVLVPGEALLLEVRAEGPWSIELR